MDLFLINFEKETDKIKNKKIQSETSKFFSEKILFDFYGIKSELLHHKNGSPYFKNENKMHVSISHSGSIIAILFTEDKAGVDIEETKKRNFKKILEYYKINLDNVSKETFYQIWTDYEARYKSDLSKTVSFIYKDYICSYTCNKDKCSVYEIDGFKFKDKKIVYKNISKIDFLPELKYKINR